jgi:hypothetical protein
MFVVMASFDASTLFWLLQDGSLRPGAALWSGNTFAAKVLPNRNTT